MAFFFFLFAIIALAGAVGVVTLRNPFYCVLSLVAHLIALALLFLLLEAQFVAAAQIIVYAGAVMVLYVFVVAYVGGGDHPRPLWRAGARQRALAVGFGAALFVELSIAVLGTGLQALGTKGPEVTSAYGSPGEIGAKLLTDYLLPFELASFLLLAAAVGAVALAGRRGGLEADDRPLAPEHGEYVAPPRPAATGTMSEGVAGYGVTTPLPEPRVEDRELRTRERETVEPPA
ncbi:MAG TPA: NADH-quinone oxidoreductase subunit J [Solirubrobacteraceae bacterium]|nr:NADH-quinone oxidoreductase subunit J [Solirubrobacteraceae bacterium]